MTFTLTINIPDDASISFADPGRALTSTAQQFNGDMRIRQSLYRPHEGTVRNDEGLGVGTWTIG